MRKLVHFMLTAVLFILLRTHDARATEVLYQFTNNVMFAVAVSNPPNGDASQEVFVTRAVVPSQGLTTFLSFYYTSPDGCFIAGGGYIPNSLFQVNANGASLGVDTSTLPAGTIQTLYSSCGAAAPSGLISINWTVTGSQRTSGSSAFQFGNITYRFSGTRREDVSNISGTLFGTALIDPFPLSYISTLHNTQIVIERN